MQSLPMDSSPSRARGVITSLLVALGLLALAFAADSLVASLATAAPASERVSLSGSDIAIFNLAGRARLEAGGGTAVQVTVTTAGAQAGGLKTETRDIRGRRTLVVRYPGKRIVYPELGRGSSTSIRVRADGTFNDQSDRRWTGAGEVVKITGSGGGIEAHADLVVSVPPGQKLSLYLAAGNVTVANVDGVLRVDTGSGSVNSTATQGSLVVDTGSGTVNIGGATGPVDVDTGSGDVNVAGVSGALLHVDTGSGSIRARDISVDTLSCDTGSGNVEVAGVRARSVAIDTGSGSVEVTLTTPCEALVVDTGSGDVSVNVPQGFGADIWFESGSGDFKSDLPVTIRERGHGSFRGRIGSGAARLKVDTGSGDLRLAANPGR